MIKTRLTDYFQIEHPILSAPMAFAAGGKLAAAVTNAGALGLIGGAYGDAQWLSHQFEAAQNAPVGCGFITWNLQKALDASPALLDSILERQPRAMFLSFGDPKPFAQTIINANTPLICQVQSVADARRAIDVGANVVVAQGAEAGGHGETRGTMTIVPEVADIIARSSPKTLLCAAGGIADGRGLAAALALGADGVVVGSRLWASEEALVHPNMLAAALEATGDSTIRSSVMDIARELEWPQRYTARVLKNAFIDRWHGDLDGLIANATEQAALWKDAWQRGEVDTANTFVGEATGLIDDVPPVREIIERLVNGAEEHLGRAAGLVVGTGG